MQLLTPCWCALNLKAELSLPNFTTRRLLSSTPPAHPPSCLASVLPSFSSSNRGALTVQRQTHTTCVVQCPPTCPHPIASLCAQAKRNHTRFNLSQNQMDVAISRESDQRASINTRTGSVAVDAETLTGVFQTTAPIPVSPDPDDAAESDSGAGRDGPVV
jgi:hypothetical protein